MKKCVKSDFDGNINPEWRGEKLPNMCVLIT